MRLPKLSGKTLALLAAVGAVAVGGVAANVSKHRSPAASDTPTAQPTPHDAPVAEPQVPQCRSARLVPVNRSWGIPMPSLVNSPSTECNLRYGDNPYRGSDHTGDPETAILVLQRNLNFCYGTKLAVDGIYGNKTRAAVKTVQSKHRLTADGVYGPKTRSAMNWRLYSMATRSWSRSCSSPL
ncbi:peptidoglycan-binding domain-containing protein [Kribbella sp. WER1]